MLIRSLIYSRQQRILCSEDADELKSVIFDSAGLFVDRIEDNRESIWMLSIVNSEAPASQMITPATWARLVKHFSPMSIKFGVLICDKLERYVMFPIPSQVFTSPSL